MREDLSSTKVLDLNTEVKYVKGVGPRIAEWLEQKNIHTVEDLL